MLNIRSLRLGNYRIFSDSANFRLAPLTIITGPDGSGKSSIAGSLSLMKEMDTCRLPYRLRLDSGNNGQKSFETLKNNKSKRNRISFGYDIYNIILGEDVSLDFTFEKCGDFDAMARSITITSGETVLFEFTFEEGRLTTRVGVEYLFRKLEEIKKSRKRFFELEREFKKIRSSSGTYKEKSGASKSSEMNEGNVRVFHIDNDLKRKNVRDYLNKQEMTTGEYERLFYFYGKQRKPAGVNGSETGYISRIKKILADYNENDILLNNEVLKSILRIPVSELNENNLKIVLKNEHPDLHDCLLLLNNDALSTLADLLKMKQYPAWEQDFLLGDLTTSERLKDSVVMGELSGALEHHMQTMFGESQLFMAVTELCASREEFLQVYYGYLNLNALNSFCVLVLDKTIYDLEQDLGKSLFIPLMDKNHGPSVEFSHPMHKLIRDYLPVNDKDTFLRTWLRKFNVCEDLSFEIPIKGMGYFPWLKKNSGNFSLGNEGAGTNRLLRILLEIVNAKQCYGLRDYNDDIRNYPGTIMIEEPEARMHPAWQSKLAGLFADAYRRFGLHFMIETYSEHLIRKAQFLVATGQLSKEEVVIYYVDGSCKGAAPSIMEITIDDEGNLSQELGKSFFDEEDTAAMEMIRLRKINRN